MKGVMIALGLVIGNFIYQAATGQQWDVAIDRSVFQTTAVALMALRRN